jgi:hypothetical protein
MSVQPAPIPSSHPTRELAGTSGRLLRREAEGPELAGRLRFAGHVT